jgi:L-amino acid N-acyltransferase YncA
VIQPPVNEAVARERRLDLERAAGCCSPVRATAVEIRPGRSADAVGEYTIYLDREARGRGLGRRLLDAVVTTAEAAGYWKLQGRLFTSNEASVALARRCGFRQVGVYERHGRLDGEWKDLLIVERLLGDAAAGED